jgi:hypothetical protein
MKLPILSIALMALLLASCGSSSKGPGGQITAPERPPTGSGPAPGPQPPVVPGIGTQGKLSMHVEAGGSVTTNPNIGNCIGRADCEFTVDRGTIVTLTAIPNAGSVFEEWDNCPGPSGLQCVITVDALTYVKAEFDRAP